MSDQPNVPKLPGGYQDAGSIEQIISNYLDQLNAGKSLDPKEILAENPSNGHEILETLQEFIDLGTSQDQPHDLDSLSDYRIIRQIGEGGSGTVYEAEQIPYSRRVALKVLYRSSDRGRFNREIEAISRLQHPAIVVMYEAGDQLGIDYIAQELIEGGFTLSDHLRELKKEDGLPPGYFREVAKRLVHVAEALQHAHESGVIHRDIKPSNILLTKDGHPKVTDFGLAKIKDTLALTRSGESSGGTPHYMSPEQAESKRSKIDHRTDIYSLGVTLYEMLTFQRPFKGDTSMAVLRQIISVDPVDPNKANPRVPRDLSVICLKAMEKVLERRYQSMKEFSEDLERFLSGDVILARPAGLSIRFWKRVKRNPVVSAAVVVAILTTLFFIGYELLWSIPQLRRERDRAVYAEGISDERAQEIQKNYDAIMRLSDVKRLAILEADADALWPAYPENIPGFEEWLRRADEVLGRLDEHRQTLVSLRENALSYGDAELQKDRETQPQWEALVELMESKPELEEQLALLEVGTSPGEGSAEDSGEGESSTDPDALTEQLAALDAQINELEETVSARRTWTFEDTETQWQHDMIEGLVSGLEALSDEKEGLLKSVRERLEFASNIEERSIGVFQDLWDEAIASIADKAECPQYGGLAIEPMVGYVPIGRDPSSGLWEFAHLQTGEIPVRDTEGKLFLDEKSCLVFVLIPGGTFVMGAVKPSEDNPIGSQNVDPEATSDEGPVHEVTLKPFLLSKYEMIQGQWLRFTKENPSAYGPGEIFGGKAVNLLHPVEQVSWEDCADLLYKLKLRLPSESEWEYAARGGTSTVFWTGDDKKTLQGAANLADLFCKKEGGPAKWPYEEWMDDGYSVHAPVGSYSANAFGLHDVHGNVFEWCQDIYVQYENTPVDGSAINRGLTYRVIRGGSSYRAIRGGCWGSVALFCRSAHREGNVPGYRYGVLGFRPASSCP